MKKPAHPLWWYIATWFGIGFKPASGTLASLAALPLAYAIHTTLGNFALLGVAMFLFVIGWWAAKKYIHRHPGKGLDPHDIVIDEVAGQCLVLSVLYPTWQSYMVGFLLFRLFDIVKPWPVSWADKEVKGAVGVMFDDFLAAMYPVMLFLIVMLEVQLSGTHDALRPVMNFLSGSHAH